MFIRLFAASVFTLGLSVTAAARCAPCSNLSDTQNMAYSHSSERGVSVMRGNIPTLGNVRAGQLQDRRADNRAYERARVRAVHAERRADKAQTKQILIELARETRTLSANRYNNRYYAPRRGYLISAPSYHGYGHHGYGHQGYANRGIARATFTRRIRS